MRGPGDGNEDWNTTAYEGEGGGIHNRRTNAYQMAEKCTTPEKQCNTIAFAYWVVMQQVKQCKCSADVVTSKGERRSRYDSMYGETYWVRGHQLQIHLNTPAEPRCLATLHRSVRSSCMLQPRSAKLQTPTPLATPPMQQPLSRHCCHCCRHCCRHCCCHCCHCCRHCWRRLAAAAGVWITLL